MSALAGLFGPSAQESVVRAMLARMPQRGEGGSVARLSDDGAVGVSRFPWERDAAIAGDADLVRYDGLVVAADATLYYQDDLRARLSRAGAAPSGPTAGHLILDAYRVWGVDCAAYLEGDFAFVVWDDRRGIVFCCRDGIGLRPLYYAVADRTLVVASSAAGVLAHPGVSDELNLRAIGAAVAGQAYSLGAETSYRDVRVLQAGTSMVWRSGVLEPARRHWHPAADSDAGVLDSDAAAERLRELLTRAVGERLPRTGVAAVWMSGGWDSTAVFAAGREAIRRERRPTTLRPVCISYPPGDAGREDELIQAVLDRWGTEAHWLHSSEIPLLGDVAGGAARRDEAPALLYAPWNAALAAGSRAAGARVALDGNGGDQLFGPGVTQLALLAAHGRWWSLAREWWIRRAAGPRRLLSDSLVPLLPGRARHYRDRPVAPWVRADFLARHGILEFERSLLPRPGLGVAQRDDEWLLTAPFVAWGMSRISELALGQGVELRSALLDNRLIAFALGRPWHDRARRWETKRLLRAAMRDLLPAAVLAPRPRRTGITTSYSRYWMERRYPALFEELFRERLQLTELGIVDPEALRQAVSTVFARGTDAYARINLFQLLEVEHWLRARASRNTTVTYEAVVPRDRAEAVSLQRSHVFHLTAGG